jgi:hypothetical protein
MFARRGFAVGKRPHAYYQSEPFINYIDAKEKSFLDHKYVKSNLSQIKGGSNSAIQVS